MTQHPEPGCIHQLPTLCTDHGVTLPIVSPSEHVHGCPGQAHPPLLSCGPCRKDGRRHKGVPQVKVKVPGTLSGSAEMTDSGLCGTGYPGTSLLQQPCFQVERQEKKDFHLENSRCCLTSHSRQWQGTAFSNDISRNSIQVVEDCLWLPASF